MKSRSYKFRFYPTPSHVMDNLPLKIRVWKCPGCSMDHIRDLNAAVNIKKAGEVLLGAGSADVADLSVA